RAAAITEVKRAQRLFTVSGSPQSLTALHEAGFRSASGIAQIPQTSFVEMHKEGLGGADIAALIHKRAPNVAMLTPAMSLHVLQSLNDVQPAALGERLKVPPTWAELFGSPEMCECLHCMSITGPAAYFVSLLQFLRHPARQVKYTPLDY